MKYVVYWREKGSKSDFGLLICENEEELVTTIQDLQITSQGMRQIETRIYPFFIGGQLVFNRKELKTRIVKRVCYMEGKLEVYNFDNPYMAENQKRYVIPTIPEEWDIYDCIPINMDVAINDYNFKLGTSMGTCEASFGDSEDEWFE